MLRKTLPRARAGEPLNGFVCFTPHRRKENYNQAIPYTTELMLSPALLTKFFEVGSELTTLYISHVIKVEGSRNSHRNEEQN